VPQKRILCILTILARFNRQVKLGERGFSAIGHVVLVGTDVDEARGIVGDTLGSNVLLGPGADSVGEVLEDCALHEAIRCIVNNGDLKETDTATPCSSAQSHEDESAIEVELDIGDDLLGVTEANGIEHESAKVVQHHQEGDVLRHEVVVARVSANTDQIVVEGDGVYLGAT